MNTSFPQRPIFYFLMQLTQSKKAQSKTLVSTFLLTFPISIQLTENRSFANFRNPTTESEEKWNQYNRPWRRRCRIWNGIRRRRKEEMSGADLTLERSVIKWVFVDHKPSIWFLRGLMDRFLCGLMGPGYSSRLNGSGLFPRQSKLIVIFIFIFFL